MRERKVTINIPVPDREDAVRVKRAAKETVRKARKAFAGFLTSLAEKVGGEGEVTKPSDDTSDSEVFCAID